MELLLLELLRGTPGPVTRNPAGQGLVLFAIFLGLAGTAFLLAAGYSWLGEHYDPRTANVYMGLITFAVAALCAVIAGLVSYFHHIKARVYRNVVMHKVRSMVHSVVSEFDEPIQDNPKTAALLAGLAGYVAAEKLLH